MMKNSKAFLSKLDKLNYRQRWASIVAMVRESDESSIETMQDELEGGTVFHQYVSLQISIVTQNATRILASLESESRTIRTLAARTSVKFCMHRPEFIEAVVKAPRSIQRHLLNGVGRSENVELAEQVFASVFHLGPRIAAKLLPSCKPETIAEHLPDCELFVSAWPLLVKRVPTVFGEFLQQQFSNSMESQWPAVWNQYSSAIVELCGLDESRILSLFEKYCPSVAKLDSNLQQLLMRLYKKYPDVIGQLIFSKQSLNEYLNYRLPHSFAKRATEFSNQHLQTLVELLLPQSTKLVPLFKRLAPSRRREILELVDNESLERSDFSEDFLVTLPHDIRKREANRILERDGEQLVQARRIQLVSMLSYSTAYPELEKMFKSAKAEERAHGYSQLIKCAVLNQCLGDALSVLQRTANEQDPVRSSFFYELEVCQPGAFHEEQAHLFEGLIQSALDARDVSNATLSSIQSLLVKWMLHFDRNGDLYQLAMKYLKEVGRRSGGIRLPWSVAEFPAGREHDLVESLGELVRRSNQEERYGLTLHLAGRLGRRGWNVQRLDEMIAELLNAKSKHVRQSAIRFWLDNPKTRDQRVEELLKNDPSVITQGRVLGHLHFRRQDLLDPFLSGSPIKGKFLSGKTVHLLPVLRDFYRWLPRQQKSFAKLLDRFAHRKNASNWEKQFALRTKANLTVSTLEDFSKPLASEDIVTLESALGALPRLDQIGAGVDVLVSHLDSDRARVAMYALPRCLKEMPADAQLRTLKKLVGPGKVTVRKEAVRLLGKYSSAESIAVLKGLIDSENLHRDVKIAVVHAAIQSLHQEPAWDLLARLSKDENEDLCVSLLDTDSGFMNRSQRTRYAQMLLSLAEHPSSKVRNAFFVQSRRWQSQLAEPFAHAAAVRVLEIHGSPEWELAASCLARCCDSESAIAIVSQTIETLADRKEESTELEERDCPSLQRLRYLVSEIGAQPLRVRAKLGSAGSSTGQRMMQDFRTRRAGAELMLAGIQWDSDLCASQLDLLGQHLDSDPVLVGEFLSFVGQYFSTRELGLDESLLPTVNTLGDSSHVVSRLLAVEILRWIGKAKNWPSECREHLLSFRGDAEEVVRRLAFSIYTKSESSSIPKFGNHMVGCY